MAIAETLGIDRQQFVDIAPDIEAVVRETELAFDRGENVGFRVERSKSVLLPNGVLDIRQLSTVFRTMDTVMVAGSVEIPSTSQILTNEWFDEKIVEGDPDLDVIFYTFAYGDSERAGGSFPLGKDMTPGPFFDPRDEEYYGTDTPYLADHQKDLLRWLREQLADDSEVLTNTWFSQLMRRVGGVQLLPQLGDASRIEILRHDPNQTEDPLEYYTVALRTPGEDDEFTHVGIDPSLCEAYQRIDGDDTDPVHIVPSADFLRYIAKLIREA